MAQRQHRHSVLASASAVASPPSWPAVIQSGARRAVAVPLRRPPAILRRHLSLCRLAAPSRVPLRSLGRLRSAIVRIASALSKLLILRPVVWIMNLSALRGRLPQPCRGLRPLHGDDLGYLPTNQSENALKVINLASRQPVAAGTGWTLFRSHHTDFRGPATLGGFTLGHRARLVRYPNGTSKWLVAATFSRGLELTSYVFKVRTGLKFVEIDASDLDGICLEIERQVLTSRAVKRTQDRLYLDRVRAARAQAARVMQADLFTEAPAASLAAV